MHACVDFSREMIRLRTCSCKCRRCRHVTSMTSPDSVTWTMTMTCMMIGPTVNQTMAAAAALETNIHHLAQTASLTLTFTASHELQDRHPPVPRHRHYDGQCKVWISVFITGDGDRKRERKSESEVTRDRKVAGSTPDRGAIKSTRSTQPSIPPG